MVSPFQFYLFVVLGVLAAVALPVLAGLFRKKLRVAGPGGGLPPWVIEYGAIALFCVLTALLVFAFYRSQNPDAKLYWHTAVLLGFAWESGVEKVAKS
jgi:hypothetical protein